MDRNPWSRANRWVHADVIKSTAQYNNATVEYNQSKRALRPIIEFEADYQLYNSGAVAKAPIDILDTSITRAFQQVQGIVSVDTTVLVVNSTLTLTTGDRVVFASDLDDNVRNKIFEFSIQLAVDEPGDVYKAYLVEASDATVEDGNTTVVLFGENGGKQWKFNGTAWTVAQEKTSTNQEPLYDIIDNNGISFGDLSTYTGSTFVGSKIISYKRGTGADDTALGFPLSYRNIANNGDIEYENNFDNQTLPIYSVMVKYNPIRQIAATYKRMFQLQHVAETTFGKLLQHSANNIKFMILYLTVILIYFLLLNYQM